MKTIPLNHGLFALVDDADYEALSRFKWYADHDRRTWYAVRMSPRPNRRVTYMHRVILGTPRGLHTDHADGNGLNNQRSNIRIVTPAQNSCNITRKRRSKTSSRYRGVHWLAARGCWRAVIRSRGVSLQLGHFSSEIEAALAYNAAGLARDPVHFTPNVIAEVHP